MLKNFSWGHGIALALASFMIFILFLIFYFGNGMKNAEMVSDNYYDEELNYQKVIDAKSNAEKLSIKPIFLQNQSGISITFPKEITPDNKKSSIVLYRTDDANLDVKKEMQLDANNSFTIPSKIIAKGSYTLMLKWQIEKKEYQLDYNVLWK